MTLEDLGIVDEDLISVTGKRHGLRLSIEDPLSKVPTIEIVWVPTTPDCHLALTIALCLRTKLFREISCKHAKIDIIGNSFLLKNF